MESLTPDPVMTIDCLYSKDNINPNFKKTISFATTTQTSTYAFVSEVSDEGDDCFGLAVDKSQEDFLTIDQIADQLTSKLKADAFTVVKSYFTEDIDPTKPISYYKDSQPLYFRVRGGIDLEIELGESISKEKRTLSLRIQKGVTLDEVYKVIGRKIGRPTETFILERKQLPPTLSKTLKTTEGPAEKRQDSDKTITVTVTSFYKGPAQFKVEKTDTIEYLMKLIEAEYPVSLVQQALQSATVTKLEPTKTFEEYGIGNGTELRLSGRYLTREFVGLIPNCKNFFEEIVNQQDHFVLHDRLSIQPPSKEIKVKVETLTGKKFELEANVTETVLEIKEKINKREGLKLSVQRLLFNGLFMENSRSLFEYGVGDEATLHLVLRMRPSKDPEELRAPTFAGFVNDEWKWVDTESSWRSVNYGLFFEGVCKNSACKAYNKKVIMNSGLGVFDLVLETKNLKCPECAELVEPTMSAINNCYYSFTGIRQKEDGKKERVTDQKWQVAKDPNLKYDPRKSNEKWLSFKIRAEQFSIERTESYRLCPQCAGEITDEEKQLECGHTYHEVCGTKALKKYSNSCLLCHIE